MVIEKLASNFHERIRSKESNLLELGCGLWILTILVRMVNTSKTAVGSCDGLAICIFPNFKSLVVVERRA